LRPAFSVDDTMSLWALRNPFNMSRTTWSGSFIIRSYQTKKKGGGRRLMEELLPITAYVRGGCSPVGMKKAYP